MTFFPQMIDADSTRSAASPYQRSVIYRSAADGRLSPTWFTRLLLRDGNRTTDRHYGRWIVVLPGRANGDWICCDSLQKHIESDAHSQAQKSSVAWQMASLWVQRGMGPEPRFLLAQGRSTDGREVLWVEQTQQRHGRSRVLSAL